jgi:DNA topoisomerase IA
MTGMSAVNALKARGGKAHVKSGLYYADGRGSAHNKGLFAVTGYLLARYLKQTALHKVATRAEFIKTLFKLNYIRNEKKIIFATATGVDLVGIIRNVLLKSADLTGQWAKKLRDIERHRYEAKQFVDELKPMLIEVVNSVLKDNTAMGR